MITVINIPDSNNNNNKIINDVRQYISKDIIELINNNSNFISKEVIDILNMYVLNY